MISRFKIQIGDDPFFSIGKVRKSATVTLRMDPEKLSELTKPKPPVFPKGSPLLSDVLRVVLELSESKEMQIIEKKWFNKTTCYTKQGAQLDLNRLSMESFWGIFLISGTASVITLVVYLGRLIYRYIHHAAPAQSQDEEYPKSISRHLKSFVEYVDKKASSKRERLGNNRC
eukprot:Gb_03747 [translate_table: standard]